MLRFFPFSQLIYHTKFPNKIKKLFYLISFPVLIIHFYLSISLDLIYFPLNHA